MHIFCESNNILVKNFSRSCSGWFIPAKPTKISHRNSLANCMQKGKIVFKNDCRVHLQPCPRERVTTKFDWHAATHATCCPRKQNFKQRPIYFGQKILFDWLQQSEENVDRKMPKFPCGIEMFLIINSKIKNKAKRSGRGLSRPFFIQKGPQ